MSYIKIINNISVLNCVRLLTRVLPYIFEDPDWRGFFWSTLPGQSDEVEVRWKCYDFFTFSLALVKRLELFLLEDIIGNDL